MSEIKSVVFDRPMKLVPRTGVTDWDSVSQVHAKEHAIVLKGSLVMIGNRGVPLTRVLYIEYEP